MSDRILSRWRLILGVGVDDDMRKLGVSLEGEESLMDQALAAIYDDSEDFSYGAGDRSAGRQKSSPMLARWLADIRSYFKDDLVSVIQGDAMERKGLKQLLLEPETLKNVKPDIGLVSTLMSLNGRIPEKSKEAAREVVRAVVEELNRRLAEGLRRAVTGALNRREHSPMPSVSGIDWKRTIGRNIKNYNPDLGRIVPERYYFFDRSKRRNKWTVILDMDQSGSMADSVVYGSVCGCILAGMNSVKTHVVAFDTEVVDLTEKYGDDPVDMIFGVQLGGGTDINKSVAYCRRLIAEPKKTLFILLTDLYEGGNQTRLYRQCEELVGSGVKMVGLMALSDRGAPAYDERSAKKLASLGMPCFACTPDLLPEMLEAALKGRDLAEIAKDIAARSKKA